MSRRRSIRIALTTAFAVGLVFYQALLSVRAAPGDIDASFGTGGIVYDFVGRPVQLFKVLVQPDNKILVVGWAEYPNWIIGPPPMRRVFLRRYNSSGGLDLAFPSLPLGEGYDADVQSDGKFVVAGKSPQTFLVGGLQVDTVAPTVWRFTPTGHLDTTFDGDGEKVLGTLNGMVKNVEVQSTKIFVGSISKPLRGLYPFKYKVNRLSASGMVEGTVTPPLRSAPQLDPAFWNIHYAMNVSDSNSDVVVTGLDESTDDTVVLRYKKDGVAVTSFGNNGEVILPTCSIDPTPPPPMDVLFQPDGKILVFRWTTSGLNGISLATLNRLNTNGAPDFCVSNGVFSPFQNTALLQPDGKMMFSGLNQFFRYNADGTEDTIYFALTSNARAIQPDAKLVSVSVNSVYPVASPTIQLLRHLLD